MDGPAKPQRAPPRLELFWLSHVVVAVLLAVGAILGSPEACETPGNLIQVGFVAFGFAMAGVVVLPRVAHRGLARLLAKAAESKAAAIPPQTLDLRQNWDVIVRHYLATMTLGCAAAGFIEMLGLLLRFQGASLLEAAPFFLTGLLMLAYWFPRKERLQRNAERAIELLSIASPDRRP